jgi:hypothetical protein
MKQLWDHDKNLTYYPPDALMYIDSSIAYSVTEFYAIDITEIGINPTYRGNILMYNHIPVNISCSQYIYPSVRYLFYKECEIIHTIVQSLSRSRNPYQIQIIPVNEKGYTVTDRWEPDCIIIRVVDTKYYKYITHVTNQVDTYTIFKRYPDVYNDIVIQHS